MSLPYYGLLGQKLMKLTCGHKTARKGYPTDQKCYSTHINGKLVVSCLLNGENSHQRASKTAEAVQKCDGLRHLNHFYLIGTDNSENQTYSDSEPGLPSSKHLTVI